MTAAMASPEITVLTGVVESSTPTGVRIEGLWYSFPRDLGARPPDRGARVELRVNARRFVQGLRVIEPAPTPAEADRPIVRASVLKAAAHFCARRSDPGVRSRHVLQVAEAWEAWVYRPAMVNRDDDSVSVEPDKDERIKRQVAVSAAAEFLATRSEATAQNVLIIADDWCGWLNRTHANSGPDAEESQPRPAQSTRDESPVGPVAF